VLVSDPRSLSILSTLSIPPKPQETAPMAIFNNQQSSAKKDTPSFANDPSLRETAPAIADFTPTQSAPPRAVVQPETRETLKESLIAADLTIEGKIEGAGHVRIAGKFKGDVNVQGDLSIEHGAKVNGGVKAKKVIVAGELEGNIDSASRVELLDSGALTGDIKAGTLTVAAGSRIRGHVECGWEGKESHKANGRDKDSKAADLDLAS
jgi:cytoskeletal protein CcmA (bactofilin family)